MGTRDNPVSGDSYRWRWIGGHVSLKYLSGITQLSPITYFWTRVLKTYLLTAFPLKIFRCIPRLHWQQFNSPHHPSSSLRSPIPTHTSSSPSSFPFAHLRRRGCGRAKRLGSIPVCASDLAIASLGQCRPCDAEVSAWVLRCSHIHCLPLSGTTLHLHDPFPPTLCRVTQFDADVPPFTAPQSGRPLKSISRRSPFYSHY